MNLQDVIKFIPISKISTDDTYYTVISEFANYITNLVIENGILKYKKNSINLCVQIILEHLVLSNYYNKLIVFPKSKDIYNKYKADGISEVAYYSLFKIYYFLRDNLGFIEEVFIPEKNPKKYRKLNTRGKRNKGKIEVQDMATRIKPTLRFKEQLNSIELKKGISLRSKLETFCVGDTILAVQKLPWSFKLKVKYNEGTFIHLKSKKDIKKLAKDERLGQCIKNKNGKAALNVSSLDKELEFEQIRNNVKRYNEFIDNFTVILCEEDIEFNSNLGLMINNNASRDCEQFRSDDQIPDLSYFFTALLSRPLNFDFEVNSNSYCYTLPNFMPQELYGHNFYRDTCDGICPHSDFDDAEIDYNYDTHSYLSKKVPPSLRYALNNIDAPSRLGQTEKANKRGETKDITVVGTIADINQELFNKWFTEETTLELLDFSTGKQLNTDQIDYSQDAKRDNTELKYANSLDCYFKEHQCLASSSQLFERIAQTSNNNGQYYTSALIECNPCNHLCLNHKWLNMSNIRNMFIDSHVKCEHNNYSTRANQSNGGAKSKHSSYYINSSNGSYNNHRRYSNIQRNISYGNYSGNNNYRNYQYHCNQWSHRRNRRHCTNDGYTATKKHTVNTSCQSYTNLQPIAHNTSCKLVDPKSTAPYRGCNDPSLPFSPFIPSKFNLEEFIGIDYSKEWGAIDEVYNFRKPNSVVKARELNTKLYRIFNDLNLTKGGRLYGAQYQGLNKKDREKLLIIDKRTNSIYDTVEVDFSCLHLNMLYKLTNSPFTEDDYYQLDEYHPNLRPIIKIAINTLLNCTSFYSGIFSLESRINNDKDLEELFNSHTDTSITINKRIKDLFNSIFKKHSPISSYFYSGIGLKLQRLDSDIAMKILMTFMDLGIPCLCIHDSFIVPKEHKTLLEKFMNEFFNEVIESYKGKF